MSYNYLNAIKEDVKNWIRENADNLKSMEFEDTDTLREYLSDTLWIEDSVTGNGSGSYTFSTYKAEECLLHNLDLAREALEEFGVTSLSPDKLNAEYLDVTIRCYLLGQAIEEVLNEIEDELLETGIITEE